MNALALLPLCFAAQDAQAPRFVLPAPTGHNVIGTVSYEWADESRPDAAVEGEARTVLAQVWYPAMATGGAAGTVPYASPELIEACKQEQLYDQPVEIFEAWRHVETSAQAGPAAIASIEPLPVVLVSHGYGLPRALSTALCQELASHGLVAVSLDHPYGGLAVLANGRVLSPAADPVDGMDGFAQRAQDWAADMSFVIDRLAKLPPKSPVAGRLRLERVGAVGHSLGGAASVYAACDDERITAAVDMDGAPFGMEELGLCMPTLLLRSDPAYTDEELEAAGRSPEQWKEMGERIKSQWRDIHSRGDAPLYSVSVRGTSHLSYCDATYVMPDVITFFGGTFLPAQRVFDITAALVRGFLAGSLAEQPQAFELPEGLPEAELESY